MKSIELKLAPTSQYQRLLVLQLTADLFLHAYAYASEEAPQEPRENLAMVCDDCYVLLTGGADPLKIARRAK